jgi:hypothetical protein
MDRKKLVMGGMIIGGYAGSYIPALWGGDGFSFSSIIFGALGSLLGIWLGFKIGSE